MKLVRDRIPELIEESGRIPEFYEATRKEHISRLYDKMIEELHEFIENPCLEEAADMYEVFMAILDQHSMKLSAVDSVALKKWSERGGFSRGIVLKESHDDEDEWKNYCAWDK